MGAQEEVELKDTQSSSRPEMEYLHGSQFELIRIRSFIEACQCQRLIALIEKDSSPSTTFEQMPDPNFRTSETCWMDPANGDVDDVYRRIASVLGLDPAHGERMQGQRYGPGQQFKPHHDFIRTDRPHWKENEKLGGQRTWTAMLFLNQPVMGGETNFPLAGLRISPEPGTLLAWNNLDDGGAPNHYSLHEGCEVVAGSKFILTQWFRERPCRTPGLKAAIKRTILGIIRAQARS